MCLFNYKLVDRSQSCCQFSVCLLFSCITVLAILVFSGIVLLPVLLPLAGTDDALEDSAGFENGTPSEKFNVIERLALGNVRVSNPFIGASACFYCHE